MSAISATTASPAHVHHHHRMRGSKPADQTSASSARTPTDPTSTVDQASPSGPQGRLAAALSAQGVSGDSLASLRSKVEDALKQVKDSGSKNPDDFKKAVDSVVKDAGLDVSKFDDAIAAGRPQRGPGGPPPGSPPPDGTAPTDGITSTDATSAASSPSSIEAILSKAGIDPTTFKSSLTQLLSSGDINDQSVQSLFADAKTGTDIDLYG